MRWKTRYGESREPLVPTSLYVSMLLAITAMAGASAYLAISEEPMRVRVYLADAPIAGTPAKMGVKDNIPASNRLSRNQPDKPASQKSLSLPTRIVALD
jgi:hypothetical protein